MVKKLDEERMQNSHEVSYSGTESNYVLHRLFACKIDVEYYDFTECLISLFATIIPYLYSRNAFSKRSILDDDLIFGQ